MAGDTTREQLRQQLRELDAEIARLRVTSDIVNEVGDVRDSEEIAADLTSVEEREAVLGILGHRREAILDELRQLGE